MSETKLGRTIYHASSFGYASHGAVEKLKPGNISTGVLRAALVGAPRMRRKTSKPFMPGITTSKTKSVSGHRSLTNLCNS